MFYSLSGLFLHSEIGFVVIDCGGVGFKCATTMNTLKKLPKLGEKAMLFTHLNVREDALDLFGFADIGELNCFKMLISVSGVGPKAGLAILSELSPEQFALSVATGDAKALTRAQGVGAKLAQRIVLELKDKIKGDTISSGMDMQYLNNLPSDAGNTGEAISALVVLGYSRSDASLAVGRCDNTATVEEIIKQALKQLMK
jgi:Holliday junction DNA helicase RuvA